MLPLIYAVELLAQSLDEGPLRTKVLELAAIAKQEAEKPVARPTRQRGKGRALRPSKLEEGGEQSGSPGGDLPDGDMDLTWHVL